LGGHRAGNVERHSQERPFRGARPSDREPDATVVSHAKSYSLPESRQGRQLCAPRGAPPSRSPGPPRERGTPISLGAARPLTLSEMVTPGIDRLTGLRYPPRREERNGTGRHIVTGNYEMIAKLGEGGREVFDATTMKKALDSTSPSTVGASRSFLSVDTTTAPQTPYLILIEGADPQPPCRTCRSAPPTHAGPPPVGVMRHKYACIRMREGYNGMIGSGVEHLSTAPRPAMNSLLSGGPSPLHGATFLAFRPWSWGRFRVGPGALRPARARGKLPGAAIRGGGGGTEWLTSA